MKKEENRNSGFTLVELIIAMAILAFLMTAVVSFMSAGVASYKKAKADVSVHNHAQSVYNSITEMTMQANDIVLLAYRNGGAELNFNKPGSDVTNPDKLSDLCYIVKDDTVKAKFMHTPEFNPAYGFVYYKDLNPSTELYIKSIIIESGVDLKLEFCKDDGAGAYYDAFAVERGDDNVKTVINELKNEGTSDTKKDVNGDVVYDTTDTLRSIYTFDGNKMYLQRKYRYMVAQNDYYGWDMGVLTGGSAAEDSMENYLYTEALSYAKKSDSESVSGVLARVNVKEGTIYYEFKFNDKNMTYSSQGLAQLRNSYVLKPKSSRLEIVVGGSTPTDAPEGN